MLWLLPLCALSSGIFAAVNARPIIHLRGDYLCIVTIGVGEIVRIALLNNVFGITGGVNGIVGIDRPSLFGFAIRSPQQFFYLIWGFAAITVFFFHRLENSRFGRALNYLREDEVAAEGSGVNVAHYKLACFVLGAAWAGMAGDIFLRTFASATAGAAGERSIANSAAILAWPDAHADWVRPGLMLYGVSPFPSGIGADLGLRPAMTLQTEVIAVKDVRAGETVGYGGAWLASRGTRMAVIAAGYGDGYPRSVESGTPVLVNGHRAPLVGRVSMDMITVDVTELPGVAPGDPVVLWGEGVPVEEIARCAGTIPYELICGVSQRVHHELK